MILLIGPLGYPHTWVGAISGGVNAYSLLSIPIHTLIRIWYQSESERQGKYNRLGGLTPRLKDVLGYFSKLRYNVRIRPHGLFSLALQFYGELHPMNRHFSTFLIICLAVFAPISVSLATAQTETVIHSFQSTSQGDGREPFGGVVADDTGALYGTTDLGGKYGQGAVYKLSPPAAPGGAWKQNILYSFQGNDSGNRDGSSPVGNIVLTKGGKIYGTTLSGGQYGAGAVFELSPPTQTGKAWTETIIYNFYGSATPFYGLTAGAGGRLYGTANSGGRYNGGFVFALSPPPPSSNVWTETILYNFNPNGSDSGGASGIIVDSSGAITGQTLTSELPTN